MRDWLLRDIPWFCIWALGGCVCLFSQGAQALTESVGPSGSNARIVHQQGITGKGIHIGLLSSGNARASHQAFRISDTEQAVTTVDFSGKGIQPASHDTQVAGVIVAQGSDNCPDCRGIAPDARVLSARISGSGLSPYTLDRALEELIVRQGCRVIVTGIQIPSSAVRPDGQSVWTKLYDYYGEHYDVLFASAAGNSDSVVTVFGDGFNGITTGGLALDESSRYRIVGSISNAGPTADDRRKPELMAPAQRQMLPNAASDTAWSAAGSARGETSFAAPHTAGAAALLMQRAAGTPFPEDDKTLTIKAILVNTADPNVLDKSKAPTDPDTTVWHPQRGYGRIDVGRALNLLNAERIRPDVPVDCSAGWGYETLGLYEQHTYRIRGRNDQRLTLTLTWHRKLIRVSAANFIEEAPRLNLELNILSPSGKTVFSESDSPNTLRKADIRLSEDGLYEIVVRNKVYQQDRSYALAFERKNVNP